MGIEVAAAALILATAAPAAPAAAAAESWWLIHVGDDSFAFIDDRSIRASGDRRSAHVRIINAVPDDEGVQSLAADWSYDCRARTQTLLAFERAGATGDRIDRAAVADRERETQPVARETLAGLALEFACASEEERNGLPNAYFLTRPPEAVAALIPRIRALGADPEAAAFLVAFDPGAIAPGELRDGYYQIFHDAVPEARRAAVAEALGIENR